MLFVHLPSAQRAAGAAVDYQQRTSDVARRIGGKEDARERDFLDSAETLQGARSRDRLLDLGIWPYAGRRAFGVVEEIAYPCMFLASEASSYVTGALLIVDGGEGLRVE